MEDEHGPGAGHEVHMPDPSPWPIVAGAAALLLGAALVWWARDTGSDIAAVALGAAGAVALLAVAGWAYEDGRMRAKASAHAAPADANARFTQVLTFAIPEGQLDAAREGVLANINSRENSLRDLAGFQDLRIVVSPAATGTSQVMVETTWSNREGLATYDESRETLLDLINGHADQVVAGTVQVFDMEVVRDTKDVSVRFGTGTAAMLLGSLIIGGFFVGAGLTLFQNESTGTGGGGGGTPTGFAETGTIRAADFTFPDSQIKLPPNTEVTLTFDNVGNSIHNWQLFQGTTPGEGPLVSTCTAGCDKDGSDVSTPAVSGGDSVMFTFTTPDVGEYAFHCSFHPDQMKGTLVIEAGAPVPGGAGGSGSGASGGSTGNFATTGTIQAEDFDFPENQLTLPPNTEVTLTLDNTGASIHSWQLFQGTTPGQGPLVATCSSGCASGGTDVSTPAVSGGDSATFTFTTPDVGEYAFNCQFHPDQMQGTLVIKDGAPVPGS